LCNDLRGCKGNLVDPTCAAFLPAETIDDFLLRMRQLKAWSGLTLRQLERKAKAFGDVLPRSTVASALSRRSLPREQFVVSFVRACGCAPEEIQHWVAIRKKLSMKILDM
jgi:hypothetical protein